MGNKQYLYGAAVQGIQDFIFNSNKLKEIIGASELVNQICTESFKDLLSPYVEEQDYRILVQAAGNIKSFIYNEQLCAKIIKEFPRKVIEMAPGITVSQAVVELKEGETFKSQVDELESCIRMQRNIPKTPTTLGFLGIERNQRTGFSNLQEQNTSTYRKSKELYVDESTSSKIKWSGEAHKGLINKIIDLDNPNNEIWKDSQKLQYDIDDMTASSNNWIAIIHADGNGLGQLLQNIGHKSDDLRSFSEELDTATCRAAQRAFEDVAEKVKTAKYLPIRPVVLGGDDLSIICRADLAVPFTAAFMKYFEQETAEMRVIKQRKQEHKIEKLTACAGIAFIKSSFPFHFGYHLAEQLCSEAKKAAKEGLSDQASAPSCLMFHKVQDSLVSSYKDIERRDLTVGGSPIWKFGPYYISDEYGHTVENLTSDLDKLSGENFARIRSHLRQWITFKSQLAGDEKSDLKLRRVLSLIDDEANKSQRDKLQEWIYANDSNNKYPIYDLLSLYSVSNKIFRKNN